MILRYLKAQLSLVICFRYLKAQLSHLFKVCNLKSQLSQGAVMSFKVCNLKSQLSQGSVISSHFFISSLRCLIYLKSAISRLSYYYKSDLFPRLSRGL